MHGNYGYATILTQGAVQLCNVRATHVVAEPLS
jgi:hypothetical protein